MKKITPLLTGLLMILFAASAQISDTELREILDLINKDSLNHTVLCMENFVSRQCNKTVGQNRKVAQYLVNRLKTYGIEDARIDSFYLSIPNHWLAGPVNQYMYNVLGTLKGTEETDSTVIIGAHLDAISVVSINGTPPDYTLTPTAPGANDNASGCAVMIEMARIIHENKLKPVHNIDFMAYDAEELGLWGSYHDAGKRKAEKENIIVMLNNDLVGYEPDESNWGVYLAGHSNALDVREKARQALINYTTVSPFNAALDTYSSDNYAYWENGFKAIRACGKAPNPVPHCEDDVSAILNFEYLRQIARMNFVLLADYAGLDFSQNSVHNYATKDFNIEVFPVPAKDVVKVHNYNDITINQIDIYDISGRLLKSVLEINPQQNIISLNNLSNGIYFMRIETDKGIVNKKIIKN